MIMTMAVVKLSSTEDMIKVMVVYDEDPLYAGRLAEYVNQKETFPFQAMAFSDLEKLKAYGRDHEIAILLVGERVREEAKEIKAGLKMLLCDGEFVSQEEASVYKFQSGDCILQDVTFQTTVNHENKTSEEAEMEDAIAKDA